MPDRTHFLVAYETTTGWRNMTMKKLFGNIFRKNRVRTRLVGDFSTRWFFDRSQWRPHCVNNRAEFSRCRQRMILVHERSFVESETTRTAEFPGRWIDGLQVLPFILRNAGRRETTDRGVRPKDSMEQGSAAPVQPADEDELFLVHEAWCPKRKGHGQRPRIPDEG